MKAVIIYETEEDIHFLKAGKDYLKEQGVHYEEHVLSVHRDLTELIGFLDKLEKSGEKAVILAVASLSAALPGVVAANSVLPCIGVPVPAGPLNGLDALLAISQAPGEVPVTSVGLHSQAPLNACMFAHRILKLIEN